RSATWWRCAPARPAPLSAPACAWPGPLAGAGWHDRQQEPLGPVHREAVMLSTDLAAQTADLLAIANTSEPGPRPRLVGPAPLRVPACSGADAALWREGELMIVAASHPDLAWVTEAQRAAERGPVLSAMDGDGPVHCPDTLTEERWPEYAAAA